MKDPLLLMRPFASIIAAVFLAGCSTPTGPTPTGSTPTVRWVSTSHVDQFTDERTCTVTVGSLYTGSGHVYTYAAHYYPFAAVKNGQIRFGVKCGGTIPIPVGSVQIRIDDNPAWTISSSETPVDLVPQASVGQQPKTAPGEADDDTFNQMYNMSMKGMARIMSPFTATTGEKAQAIINQMAKGRKLKYRTIGMNQAASTTGEYAIDESFVDGLIKCGIPFEK